MSQTFSLGVIAIRTQSRFSFDRTTKTITDNAFANSLLVGNPPRKGWEQYYKL
jgi:hypothetical protein